MALDGAFLHKLREEIAEKALESRIDKIYQPLREEVVLLFRSKGFNGRLLLSCRGTAARIQFTDTAPENPVVPPMFCMLLRKHLMGAKLVAVEQPGLERVLFLRFDAVNEMGDRVAPALVLEILGSKANLLLLDGEGRIIDAVRRSDLENAGDRLIQPGARYELPPSQHKVNLLEEPAADVLERLREKEGMELSAALRETLDGASPIVCREAAFRAVRRKGAAVEELTADDRERLRLYLENLAEEIRTGGRPTLVVKPDGTPWDFTYIPLSQYGREAVTRELPDYSVLLDTFYAEREKAERIRRQSQDLLRLLSNLTQRTARKIAAQKKDLEKSADREKYRIYGELLKANLHRVPKGASHVELENYYDPDMAPVRIPLNAALSPAQNAQRYFKEYKKTYTAEQVLGEQIAAGEKELVYLDSVFDALSRAESTAELQDIREELAAGGYLKRGGAKGKSLPARSKPMRFLSSDGFSILVGRNNRQNDELTLRVAAKNDIWLHVKNIPGSHVIVLTEGAVPPDRTLEEAAILAAYYSKARQSASVPVDYAPVRKVKKPAGAKPGMVIYEGNRTAYVQPDGELAKKLAE